MEAERKRKAEDQEETHQEETPSKRPLLESEFALKSDDEAKQGVEQQNPEEPFYDASTETKEEDNQALANTVEEEQKNLVSVKDEADIEPKTEPSVDVKTEAAPAAPLDTLVPFDRLILLHLEATCDENPTNPAAVQVTKENSEIIGM